MARHDPIGLIADGMPMDEYEPEADTILPRLASATSAEDMRRIAHEEFTRLFDADMAGPESAYEAIGDEIWALWLESPIRRPGSG